MSEDPGDASGPGGASDPGGTSDPDGDRGPASVADELREAQRRLEGAAETLVLTGAGISAESGVPTFRGEEGLWRDRRPEELATPEAFRRDPRLVWEWYGWRRELVSGCRPNEAHLALARWSLSGGVRIATQNVDGLHTEALRRALGGREGTGVAGAEGTDGAPPQALPLRLHGSLFRERCAGCGRERESRKAVDATDRSTLPRCEACGELRRPAVVWFGEPLDPDVLGAAADAAARAEACLVVGTSGAVEPAASLARRAARSGAALIEINPARSALSDRADLVLRARAGEAVPAVVPDPDRRETAAGSAEPGPAEAGEGD